MEIKTEYNYGDIVYFKTDPEQLEYMVVGFEIRPGFNQILVSHNGTETPALPMEISKQRDIIKTTS